MNVFGQGSYSPMSSSGQLPGIEREKPLQPLESMDFDEVESVMWRKHQLRRFFQDRGQIWTGARRTTAWKWTLVVVIGILVGLVGAFVQVVTEALTQWRFGTATHFIERGDWASAFFSYLFISLALAAVVGLLCWQIDEASGSGIAELKAFLNGISMRSVVRVRVMFAKIIGVCFSVASGLPIGKEGPMIHIGAIMGAALSQGKTITFGFDTSWTKFQDFRSDRSKRDFVTYGAAAGISAAFRAPIGGILFTLEEGASFWSTALTFRAFFCAMVAMLVVSLVFAGQDLGRGESESIFSFGEFENIDSGRTNYRTYELIIFIIIGVLGGCLGALFNFIHLKASHYREVYYKNQKWKRLTELFAMTFVMAVISFVFPAMWQQCTDIPTDSNDDFTSQQDSLLDDLVQFQCPDGRYNQLASLYFTSSDIAMRQLFHFREYEGEGDHSFTSGALILFFVPYFLMAALCAGLFAPVGLFVPILVSGAAFGRLFGHILNGLFSGYVADSGTYALIGAAAMLGGMARMTISGTVIVLEAAGNMAYLLPLMVTFGAARYTGNAINDGIYEINLYEIRHLPFLPGSLNNIGLLTYFPITEIMVQPVICFKEIEKVGRIYDVLSTTKHNGFPVLNQKGHLCGIILRKTLCSLLKLRAYSVPQTGGSPIAYNNLKSASGSATLEPSTGFPQQQPWGSQMRSSSTGRSVSMSPLAKDSQSFGIKSSGSSEKLTAEREIAGEESTKEGRYITLSPAGTIFYDNLERNYPRYPKIEDINLAANEASLWLDLRPYMDTAPYSINQSASVQRCYRQFRTLGLRHLVVVDGDHKVVGMITRKDITQRRLDKLWMEEGQHLQKYISVDPLPPAVVFEEYGSPYSILSPPADGTSSINAGNGGSGGITYVSVIESQSVSDNNAMMDLLSDDEVESKVF